MLVSSDKLYSASGKMLSRSLFKETNKGDGEPVFTLSPHPQEGLISLRDHFLELTLSDPSEGEFALFVFGSVRFWNNLKKSTWLQEHLTEWRLEADILRKSKAFKAIVQEVENNGKSAFSAAKFLIDEPWKAKTKATKEATKATTEAASNRVNLSEHLQRLKEKGSLQ